MIAAHRSPEGTYDVRRDETPTRRENPSGAVRWVARYTDKNGRRRTAPKPGTFAKKGPCKTRLDDGTCCAQHRIWWAYEQDTPKTETPTTVRDYSTKKWLQRHPRIERTEAAYISRIKAALEMDTTDGKLGDMPIRDIRVRHMDDLVDVMLSEGRTASGTRNVLYVLSAMFKDAIRDDIAEFNPAQYATVRDSDPRIQNESRTVQLATWEQMRVFAKAAGEREPMIRVLSDCGLRLGEMLALHCKHVQDDVLIVEQNAWGTSVSAGTKSGRRREVPLSPEMAAMLARVKFGRIGLLFPSDTGGVWHASWFYRKVWYPAQRETGMELLPHDMRHSYVSLLRAAGADPADLARVTGHSVQTATAKYTHSTGGTIELIRSAVGA